VTSREPERIDRARRSRETGRRARNLILLIGDGMGQAHRFAGQLFAAGRRGRLAMDRLPHVGTMATLCADPESFVTDSAAAATAIATGVKTANGAVAVDLDGVPHATILELARRSGRATGLITTCQLTDATPAAFGAHVLHRSDQSEIARQYLHETGVDLLLGGGGAYWYPEGAPTPLPNDPTDPRDRALGTAGDLTRDAAERGYAVVTAAGALRTAVRQPSDGPRRLLGLFANQEMFRQSAEGEGDRYDPPVSLADMTEAAIDLLSRNPNGFFLMVEEAAIDRMAHRNNAPMTIKGVLELDRAVQVALAFAERDPDTLIVVTADHECGGLAIAGSNDPPYPYEQGGGLLDTVLAGEDGPFPIADATHGFVMGWATTGHTASAVPITAQGPSAERIAGPIENTDLFTIMVDALDVGGAGATVDAREAAVGDD